MEAESSGWRRCNSCKKWIGFETLHWVCNVSTCNRKRTGLVFCTVSCWDAHLPLMNHRESWAVEKTSPTAQAAAAASPRTSQPRRRLERPSPGPSGAPARAGRGELPREILIVASRLKSYVQARSGMNTSERALAPLSDIVRRVCDEAIRNAERDGRKTVLDRDVPDA